MTDEPRILSVTQDGSGDYRSIQAALDAARPGDTVLVLAGVYTEDLQLRQGVTLQGEGPELSRVVAASADALSGELISEVAVLDLGIDGAGHAGRNTVYLTAVEASFTGCVITGAALSGIEANDGSRLVLRGNTLRSNQQTGVFIYQDGEGLLENNLIAENGLHGIAVRERGRLTAIANTIAHNTECGVWVYNEGQAELRHNLIAQHKWGISATGNPGNPPAAEVLLRRNCVWSNQMTDYEGELDHANDLNEDPRFVDAAGGDYHLLEDSPCIGAGEDGVDLGAFRFERPAPQPIATPPQLQSPLRSQLRSLALCHVQAEGCAPERPATWLRGAGAAGWALPLGLARDLGLLLTQPAASLSLAKPAHLPFDEDSSAYLAFLKRVAAHPLVRELPGWKPALSDAVLGVVLARLVEGLALPDAYRPPSGPDGVRLARVLQRELPKADPARLWREAAADSRPRCQALLPTESLARIEHNLARLDLAELRFLNRYGAPLGASPDPRDLLDLLALTGLPPQARLALSQTLQLLPRLGDGHSLGGLQTYPSGGYQGLARHGSLDSLLPSEHAYPEQLFLHRVLNREALYYGRESPREQRRDLAYLVMQLGYGLGGDGQTLARALLLALGQMMRKRGYDVAYSFAGAGLSPPRPLDKPGEVARVLHAYEPVLVEPEPILRGVLAALRGWRTDYRGRHVLWVLAEHFDADFPEDHAALYRELQAEAGQQAWFVRLGAGPKSQPDPPPPSARYFSRWQRIATTLLHTGPD